MASAASPPADAIFPLAEWLANGTHEDLILVICKALVDAGDLIRFSLTCRAAHRLVHTEAVWSRRCQLDFGLHPLRLYMPPLLNLEGDWGAPPEADPYGLGLGKGLRADSPFLPTLPPVASWRFARDTEDVHQVLTRLKSRRRRMPDDERFAADYGNYLRPDLIPQPAPQPLPPRAPAKSVWNAWHAVAQRVYGPTAHTLPPPPPVLREVFEDRDTLPSGLPTALELWAHLLCRALQIALTLAELEGDILPQMPEQAWRAMESDVSSLPTAPLEFWALQAATHGLVLQLSVLRVYHMYFSSTAPFSPRASTPYVHKGLVIVGIIADEEAVQSCFMRHETGAMLRACYTAQGDELECATVSPYAGEDGILHWLERLAAGMARGCFSRDEQIEEFWGFPLSGPTVSRAITDGIEVRASPIYVFHPGTREDMVLYGIRMRLVHEDQDDGTAFDSCQLATRQWSIQRDQHVQRVVGPGVVGLYPNLRRLRAEQMHDPKTFFTYASLTQGPFPGDELVSRMWGSFNFSTAAGREINAVVAAFDLRRPAYRWV